MTLSDNIRILREENSLTQQQLADRLYVSRQTVCRWETGSRCPDLFTAGKLAKELGVSLDELLGEDTTDKSFPDYSIRLSAMNQQLQILRKRRQKVMNFIQVLGIAFLVLSVGCRIRFHMQVPVWLFVTVLIAVVFKSAYYIVLTRKIREMEENGYE